MKVDKLLPVFTDNRGTIWELLTGNEVCHIGYITSKKGSIRGNHYHKKEIQYTLVIHGRVRIIIKNLSKPNSKIETCELKEMEKMVIPPLYYHSVESLEDSEILFFSTIDRSKGGYENDTVKVDDINSFKMEYS